ncbi:Thaumatin-like protein [Vitis vinifera]|uniref:Thaumatin-like protein n=1 Tax=Vitis vinifera TaxID=29760 RepID=A0A438BZL8_VITVI|nr:Thaumatin-like protein [Vitis vinifera]
MGLFKTPLISSFLLTTLFFASCHAATLINIQNHCSYTVWAAAVPGGGRQLGPGQSWSLDANPGTARVWARTNCTFDGSGNGTCETRDCGGRLQCQAYGTPPNTLAEFALNQFNNMDFFDISLVDGFNVPMALNSTSNGCTRGIQCSADIVGQCPDELRAPGGCNNPCTVSGPMNIVVILGTVALQLTPSFSRIGVRWLIATLMMIKQAPLHALVVLTMMLSSAHDASTSPVRRFGTILGSKCLEE